MPDAHHQLPRLTVACHEQERRFGRAFAILEEGIRGRAFPGAAAAVTSQGRLIIHKAVGRFTYDPSSSAVEPATIYDLASLTKVMATTAAAMVLFERGRLRLETGLVEILPEFAVSGDPRRQEVTLRMLLAHSSGLPAYARLFEQAQEPQAVLRAAAALPLEADPGCRATYSDPGFVLLGEALQRLAGESLDVFCRREVYSPLAMGWTCFCPPEEWRSAIPPAEEDRSFRRRLIQGEVQDENASALGGVAGHAGLFAPALEVAAFAECLLNGGAPLWRRDTVEHFTARESSPAGTSRTLGWDTPTAPSQSGKYFSPRAYGHLGYAGTSLWIDPERKLSVTLLTNRTWPDRTSQLIKQYRPAFHDAVIEAL
jgi:CubicO group peptidase (beta-lactamase class C family)